jgi:hypothetical protein
MKLVQKDTAWDVLIERKQANRKESRVAFIAALLMERVRNEEGALRAHVAAIYAAEFVRLAESIHHLCEAACNYELSPTQESRLANLEKRFSRLAEALGFEARTGGDPRGACAYLIDPDDRKGDGFGEGFAVYA